MLPMKLIIKVEKPDEFFADPDIWEPLIDESDMWSLYD